MATIDRDHPNCRKTVATTTKKVADQGQMRLRFWQSFTDPWRDCFETCFGVDAIFIQMLQLLVQFEMCFWAWVSIVCPNKFGVKTWKAVICFNWWVWVDLHIGISLLDVNCRLLPVCLLSLEFVSPLCVVIMGKPQLSCNSAIPLSPCYPGSIQCWFDILLAGVWEVADNFSCQF